MKKLRVLNSTGDTVLEFDETKALDEAKALFEKLKGEGAAVFAVGAQGDKRVAKFSELGEENVAVLRIVGG